MNEKTILSPNCMMNKKFIFREIFFLQLPCQSYCRPFPRPCSSVKHFDWQSFSFFHSNRNYVQFAVRRARAWPVEGSPLSRRKQAAFFITLPPPPCPQPPSHSHASAEPTPAPSRLALR